MHLYIIYETFNCEGYCPLHSSALLQQSLSLLGDSLGSSLTSSSVLGSSSLSLGSQSSLTLSISLSLDDVLNQGSLVLESVTLGLLVQTVVQMSVDLTGVSVLSKQSSQNSQSSDPDDLRWQTSLGSTLSLTVTGVTTSSLCLSVSSSSGSGVDGDSLLNDGTVLDQSSDSASGVSLGDLRGLVWVQPDLSLTDAHNRGGKSLLST